MFLCMYIFFYSVQPYSNMEIFNPLEIIIGRLWWRKTLLFGVENNRSQFSEFTIIGRNYGNWLKRRIAKSLYIKEKNSGLNVQFIAYKAKLLTRDLTSNQSRRHLDRRHVIVKSFGKIDLVAVWRCGCPQWWRKYLVKTLLIFPTIWKTVGVRKLPFSERQAFCIAPNCMIRQR